MASERLQIIIDAEWKGKGDVQQANKDLQNMDGAAKKSGGSMLNLAGKAAQFAQVAGAAAAGAALAWKTIGQGAELELATQRFDNLTRSIGSTSEAMLGDLARASGGMMTNAESIASASQIISLGLADNQQDVVDLASLVSQLGWDMQQVIMTFANNSKMRLDALGLSVTDVEERAKRLEAQGYSTDKAFDLAVIQAGQAKLELLGSAANTSAGGMERLKNRIIDAKDGLLEFIAVRSGPAFTGLANYMDAVEQAQADMNEAVRKGIITQEEADTIVNLSARGHDQWQQKLRDTRAELDRVNRSLETSTATATAYYVGMGRLAEAERAHTATVADMNYHQEEAYEGMISSTAVLEANAKSLEDHAASVAIVRGEYETAVGVMQSFSTTISEGYGAAALAAEDSQARQITANDAISESYKTTALNVFSAKLAETIQEDGLGAANAMIAYQQALGLITPEEAAKLEEVALKTEAITDATGALFDAYMSDGVLTREEMDLMAEAVRSIDEGTSLMSDTIIRTAAEDIPKLVGLHQETATFDEKLGNASSSAGILKDNLDALPTRLDIDVYINTHGNVPDVGGTSAGGNAPSGGPGGNGPGPGGSYASGTGGWVTVPPGYPNDTYHARLTSGERFNVIPAGQSGGMGGGGATISISFAGAIFQGTSQQQAAQIAQMTADKLGRLV